MAGICDNCQKKEVLTSCEFCGSTVCKDCKLEEGCKSCNGGIQTF